MGKLQHHNMDYKSKSKNEAYILELIRSEELITFGVDEVKALSDWKKTRIYHIFSSLEEKGHITRIKRDTYTLTEYFYDRTFKVITDALNPSYISFWTALSYYGFTDQQVNMVQLVSTKQMKDLNVREHKVRVSTFKPERFYGYDNEDGFVIADREKTLVDSLYQLEKCGGFEEYIKCLRNGYEEVEENKLSKYAVDFENKSLVSRLGYILEYTGLGGQSMIKELKEHISQSYVLLDPDGGEVRDHNSDWKIKINRDLEVVR